MGGVVGNAMMCLVPEKMPVLSNNMHIEYRYTRVT